MSVLAWSKNIGTDYFVNVPKRRNLLIRIYDSLKNWKGIEFAGFKFERENQTPQINPKINRHTLYETHPSAWIKGYNEEYPYCGLFRIWDYCPRIFSDLMLEELYAFCLGVANRIE